MPNKDKTGPEGKGSKTGRGLGDCGDNRTDGQKGLGLRKNAKRINNQEK